MKSIEDISRELRSIREKKIKVETELEGLKREKEKILEELKELGVEPQDLKGKISELEEGIEKDISSIEIPEGVS